MARRAHAYPQVSLLAADLVDGAVVAAPSGITAADALRLGRRRHAGVVACGRDGHALVHDLARAVALGLSDVPARELISPLPVLEPRATEAEVRRHLARGAPAVVVAGRGRALGVVTRGPEPRTLPITARLASTLPPATLALLGDIARLAAAHGARAFLAGGLVRDLWRGERGAARDLDVVVEGDAPAVARSLADALGGALVEHERFLTASVTGPLGRVDLVTARSERYEAPGALPRVLPASIAQDLRRRDFTVNAMAVELGGESFELLDPLGGTEDLARKRLRILHPLSFVEDPTRILRAARYATRLSLAPDRWTERCQALALRLAPYPALSGQRIAAELERVLAEPRPAEVLRRLLRAGALRLLDARYKFTGATARRLDALGDALAWSATHRLTGALPLAALALTADQPPAVADACLARLGLAGEPRARVERARDAGRREAAVAGAATRSAVARALRAASGVELAWLRLVSAPRVRERVEWYVTDGRHVASSLSGDDVVALGVSRGPAVAEALGRLRDARLDGAVIDRDDEVGYVRALTSETERKG
ncbi:MAG TPA: hypothetical protein VGR82_09260 [Methylomirabilota bacterium]|nr:hypothetical protein [Methylomirabilota bacterium]